MIVIDGKKIAQRTIEELKTHPKPIKKLAAVLVGESPASISFLKQKERVAQELGVEFQLYKLPENIEQEDLESKIESIGNNERVGGMILQLPLPAQFNRERVLAKINPAKDIDALTPAAPVEPLPVGVVKDILLSVIASERGNLEEYLKDKVVAVVGRGILVGKPIAEWLKGKCRAVLVLYSGSNLAELNKADLIISAAGKAGLINPRSLKNSAAVIDFGFDMKDGKISGDLATENLESLSFYTPTPGGTGPILVAKLFENFYKLL